MNSHGVKLSAAPSPDLGSDLAKLSERSALGPWSVSGVRKPVNEQSCVYIDAPSCSGLLTLATGAGAQALEALADAKFVVALVNAYRSGRLVEASASPPPAEDLAGQGEPVALPVTLGWHGIERLACEGSVVFKGGHVVLIAASDLYGNDISSMRAPVAEGTPAAWAYEFYSDAQGRWFAETGRTDPAHLNCLTRNVEPLFKRAAPAPPRPADREEIARIIYASRPSMSLMSPHPISWDDTIQTYRDRAYEAADRIIALMGVLSQDGGGAR